MSVEEQAENLPDGSVPQKTKVMEASAVQGELVDGKEKIANQVVSDVTESVKVSAEEISKTAARSWFESLSAKERVAAFGFTDGPFFATFLELASWSTLKTAGSEEATSGVGKFSTTSTWSLRAFEPAP